VPASATVFESLSDSLLNAFAKIKKPDEKFEELKETIDKLEDNLNTVERLYTRINKRQQGTIMKRKKGGKNNNLFLSKIYRMIILALHQAYKD
jgi:hypothetical protein